MESFFSRFDQAIEDTDGRILIWTLKDKKSAFFASGKDAAAYAAKRAKDSDVYYGVNLYRAGIENEKGKSGKTGTKRGGIEDIVALLCMWADLDCHVPGIHKDAALPPDKDAAMKILDKIGIEPSLVIDSGYGIQALWMLNEPMIITTPEDRQAAAAICTRWGQTLLAVSKQHGFTYDTGIHDLSRILRVPESKNMKQKTHRSVKTLRSSEGGVGIDRIHEVMIVPEQEVRTIEEVEKSTHADRLDQVVKRGKQFIVNYKADVNDDMIELLCQSNETLNATWNFTRRFESGDDTFSSYAMSLAVHMIESLGASNQMVVDAVCAMARRWRERKDSSYDLTKHKYDWWVRLLHKAGSFKVGGGRGRGNSEESLLAKESHSIDLETIESQDAGQADGHANHIQFLRERIGFPIAGLEQHGEDDAYYVMLVEGRDGIVSRHRIGNIAMLMDQNRLRQRICEISHSALLMRELTKSQWDVTLRALLRIVRYIEHDNEPKDRMESWLSSYSKAGHILDADGSNDAIDTGAGFLRDGHVWINVPAFASFLSSNVERSITEQIVRQNIKLCDFRRRTFANNTSGSSRSYWGKPLDSISVPIQAVKAG